jgi:asparagine synthetase B (glutamine-hydrolysing)
MRVDEPARTARSWVARYRQEAPPGAERLICEGDSPPAEARAGDFTVLFDGVLFDGDVPDAESLAKRFRADGPDCLPGLRGHFALIASDARDDTLVCARDHLGVQALFYLERDGEWLFSPDVDSLVTQPRVSDIDRVAAAGHLTRRWLDLERTFFGQVRRLPPGHALMVRKGQARVYRYWDPTAADEEPLDPAEAVRRFEALLERATRRALRLGRAGVFLSGGVDSSVVAAVAAKVARDDGAQLPLALSLVLPHPSCNEERAQRHSAAALALPHVVVALDETVPGGLVDTALDLYATLSWPSPNLFRAGYDFLARKALEQGVAVVLTGGGGQMLDPPAGYPADRLRALDVAALSRFVRARRFYAPDSTVLERLRLTLWTLAARQLLRDTALRIRLPRARRGVTAAYRRHVERSFPAWLAPEPGLRRQVVREVIEQACPPRALRDFPDLGLGREAAFARSRRLGVCTLSPILDPDVVEFLMRVPTRLLNRGGQAKRLAFDVLRRQAPLVDRSSLSAVRTRFYRNEVLRREGPAAWRKLGGVRVLAELGIVDGTCIEAEAQDPEAWARASAVDHFWRTLNLEAWLHSRL